ncbi:hypothetical protein PHACT_06010 [Pseudohongiella acticola]|uniref:Uncharacterized protein n=1 Tax=Pseudohongiella acticola TaxID=1524254 RepID=A0A1E8CJV2_9GAMM|nr:hypothetical protein [Pseudohongiella acticola]OFE12746.1 hypothetical protein PHACT_06010 [Pseudohongiella acticola]
MRYLYCALLVIGISTNANSDEIESDLYLLCAPDLEIYYSSLIAVHSEDKTWFSLALGDRNFEFNVKTFSRLLTEGTAANTGDTAFFSPDSITLKQKGPFTDEEEIWRINRMSGAASTMRAGNRTRYDCTPIELKEVYTTIDAEHEKRLEAEKAREARKNTLRETRLF